MPRDPIFPVAFLVHERKHMRCHKEFFLDILKFLKLDKSTKVPFVTDREKGTTKPLRHYFPNLTNVIYTNYILRDVNEWLRKNSGKFDDKNVLKDDVERLITSKDEAEFHDTYDVLSST